MSGKRLADPVADTSCSRADGRVASEAPRPATRSLETDGRAHGLPVSELGLCCTLVCGAWRISDSPAGGRGAHCPLQDLERPCAHSSQEEALVAACDLPALPSEGLQRMLSGAGPAVARLGPQSARAAPAM